MTNTITMMMKTEMEMKTNEGDDDDYNYEDTWRGLKMMNVITMMSDE